MIWKLLAGLGHEARVGRARGRLARTQALAVLLAALCLTPRASAEPERVAKYALVIGNNRADGVETLHYADDDALGMHELFLEAQIDSRLLVSLDSATRELHPDVRPTGAATLLEVERQMAALRSEMAAQAARGVATELYLFFSGHGDVDGGEGRLILEDRALTRGSLYDLLVASGAGRSHVFLDACSSFLVASKRPDAQHRAPIDPSFARGQTPDDLANVGFVLSSSSDRESHEWERYEAGVVSHELRSGLRGAADSDLDGSISYAELAAFLRQANRAIDIPRLRPDPWITPPGKQNWQQPVLSWRSGAVSVRLEGGATGHIFVENLRGERLLDAHPEMAQWLHLHLPADRPLYIRANTLRSEYELTSLAPTAVSELAFLPVTLPRAKGAEQRALSQLFAAPFGQSHVLEYERDRLLSARSAQQLPRDGQRSGWLRPLGYTAATALLAGGALSATALIEYLAGRDASQIDAHRANQRIARYHRLSLLPYLTAAATGAAWAWLKFGSDGGASVALLPIPSLGRGPLLLGVDGRF